MRLHFCQLIGEERHTRLLIHTPIISLFPILRYFFLRFVRYCLKHFISCNRNDYQTAEACDVAYPEEWQIAKHGLNYLQRQRRDRIIENVSKKDIYIKGRKMVNPLIGIIPSREEIENELSDLLMSM